MSDSISRGIGLAHHEKESIQGQDSHEDHLEIAEEGKDDAWLHGSHIYSVSTDYDYEYQTSIHQ